MRLPTLAPISISTTKRGNVAFEVMFSEEGEEKLSSAARRSFLASWLSMRTIQAKQWKNRMKKVEHNRNTFIKERCERLRKRNKLVEEVEQRKSAGKCIELSNPRY